MSWASLPPEVREVAERVLTPKQREAFELELAGWGLQRSADYLNIRRVAVRDRLTGAHKRLLDAGLRMDPFGRWYIEHTTEEVAA